MFDRVRLPLLAGCGLVTAGLVAGGQYAIEFLYDPRKVNRCTYCVYVASRGVPRSSSAWAGTFLDTKIPALVAKTRLERGTLSWESGQRRPVGQECPTHTTGLPEYQRAIQAGEVDFH